jgi:hypothetical protein
VSGHHRIQAAGIFFLSGTLTEYCPVPEDMLGAAPENMSFDDASTVGVGSWTAALGLWKHLGPASEPGSAQKGEAVLLYDASSSVGAYAVQLAAVAAYRVVTVASGPSSAEPQLVDGLWRRASSGLRNPVWVDHIARETRTKQFVAAWCNRVRLSPQMLGGHEQEWGIRGRSSQYTLWHVTAERRSARKGGRRLLHQTSLKHLLHETSLASNVS